VGLYQPAIDPWRGTIENNAQNFILEFPTPGSKNSRLFYHFGTHGEIGLSHTRPDGTCLSVAGLFYDRNNSLLASMIYAATKDYRLRLNVYPGLVKIGSLGPSFFLALSREDRILVGVDLRLVKHLPFGIAGSVN
jgi:hypothetical protein